MGDLFASSGHFPCSLEFIALLERDYFISRVDDLIDYKNLQFAWNTFEKVSQSSSECQISINIFVTLILSKVHSKDKTFYNYNQWKRNPDIVHQIKQHMPFSERLCVIWIFFNCQTREKNEIQIKTMIILYIYPTCNVLSYYSCLNTPLSYFIHLAIVTKHRYHHNGSSLE